MAVARSIIIWLGRHAVALTLIILILIFARYALAPLRAWANRQMAEARTLPQRHQSYEEALQAFDRYAAARRAGADAATASLARKSEEALRARRARLGELIAETQKARLTEPALALAAVAGNSKRIFDHYRAGAEIALHLRERAYIDALLEGPGPLQGVDLEPRRRLEIERLQASEQRWRAARRRAQIINGRPLGGVRNSICRNAPLSIGCDNYRALVAARREMEVAAAAHRQARLRLELVERALRSRARAKAALGDSRAQFEQQRTALSAQVTNVEQAARSNWYLWVQRPVTEVLPTALWILALAIFGPMLIKVALYFGVAPIAARRPPIRIVADERGEVKALHASGASQHLALQPGQTLLVIPEALQSTPHHVTKWTQWLLSYRMPLSSLASGMVALVGLRAARPDSVRIAATKDPLAEIAPVRIGSGSAMVLRPRALRGILLGPGETPRITRHWRLHHLSAWLTLQFRYVVFHGPCMLLVQGRRCVRLERADTGRGINQAATMGFSAGLAYSVSRSEAFGAYLLGKQELFNDSFAGPAGYCLYEQMPMDARKGGLWGRGLRGLGDAALKIFGI